MGEPSSGTPPVKKPPEDRLDSWKEIASYLDRDVTTVQRWEKREGMPVHRHLHDRMGSVYAFGRSWTHGRAAAIFEQRKRAGTIPSPPYSSEPPSSPIVNPSTRQPDGSSSYRWLRPQSRLRLAQASGSEGRSTSGETRSLTRGFRPSRTSMEWRRPPPCHATVISWRFCPTATDRWTSGLRNWVPRQFHNLTHGSAPELVNPSVRTLGFSPNGSLVTFWVRKQDGSKGGDISVWAVPTLGGQPQPYLEGVAEFDWSRDGSRLAYHTPGPGDPLFVSDGSRRVDARPIFTAPAGLHSHFPSWAPDAAFIYFVQGSLPNKLDIWRITPAGGTPEQITSHNAPVSYPILLDSRTLMYLAGNPDGSGPWLYSMDVNRRIPHRLTSGLDRYTSLSAAADGRRLVATLASTKKTLWRLPIPDSPAASPAEVSAATRISLATSAGSSPRLGPDYLVYVSATGTSDSIWKLANGTNTELWSGPGARVFGGPAISPDGRNIAFSVGQHGQTLLYVMQSDGANARIVADSLDLQGSAAWAPDGQSITSAAADHGVPHLFRVPVDGRSPAAFVKEYSVDPAWAPDGHFVVYSGPDIGTTFSVKAVTAQATAYPLPALTLTRGARHLAFLPGGRALVLLRGDIQHKNLWSIDLDTGAERQLTNFAGDFNIRDFDISPDGRELVLERVAGAFQCGAAGSTPAVIILGIKIPSSQRKNRWEWSAAE